MIEKLFDIFIQTANVGLAASCLILFVLLLRLFAKKLPPKYYCIMWRLVGLRLIFPISFKHVFGFLSAASSDFFSEKVGEVLYTDSEIAKYVIFSTPNPNSQIENRDKFSAAICLIWLSGIIIFLLYMLVSTLRVKHHVALAVHINENVWGLDKISSPFVFGLIKPRIFLPSGMPEQSRRCALLHEKAHIKRKDYIWKPIGFLISSFYWYNPLIWLAYTAFCRDMETACDEYVIKDNFELKNEYLNSLLSCAASGASNLVCPFSLGKIDLKKRILHIGKYKKRNIAFSVLGIVLCIFVAGALLTVKTDFFGSGGNLPDGEPSYTYIYQSDYDSAGLALFTEDKSYTFSQSFLSSYIDTGKYEEHDDLLLLKSDNGNTYYFDIKNDKLVFRAALSSEMPAYRYRADDKKIKKSVPDGAVFRMEN